MDCVLIPFLVMMEIYKMEMDVINFAKFKNHTLVMEAHRTPWITAIAH